MPADLYMGLVALSLNQRMRKMSSLLPLLITSQGRKALDPAWAVACVLGTENTWAYSNVVDPDLFIPVPDPATNF